MLPSSVRYALLQERSGKFSTTTTFIGSDNDDGQFTDMERSDAISELMAWCAPGSSSWYQVVLLFDRLRSIGAFSADEFESGEISLTGWCLVCASLISQVNDHDGWVVPGHRLAKNVQEGILLRRKAEIHILIKSEGMLHGPTIEIFLSHLRVIMLEAKVFGPTHSYSSLYGFWTATAKKILYQTAQYFSDGYCPSLIAISIVYAHYILLGKADSHALGKWPTGILFRAFHHSHAAIEQCVTKFINPNLARQPIVPCETKLKTVTVVSTPAPKLVLRAWDVERDSVALAIPTDSTKYIGQGTYGIVYNTPLIPDKAVKRMTFEITPDDGSAESPDLHYATIREIGMATQTHGLKYTCQAQEIVMSPTHMYLIMPKYTGTLREWIYTTWLTLRGAADQAQATAECAWKCKSILWQIAKGVSALHDKSIAHRDLHPGNVLCQFKEQSFGHFKGQSFGKKKSTAVQCVVADFGLARNLQPQGTIARMRYSSEVQSLFYRAPEVVLGKSDYTVAIDCWSFGCIVYELLMLSCGRRPADKAELYAFYWAKTPLELMENMILRLGKPTEQNWPGCTQLSNYVSCCRYTPVTADVTKSFKATLSETSAEGLSLLEGLLTFDPEKRMSMTQVLRHPFFLAR
jgi:serine/threonine protein kinase